MIDADHLMMLVCGSTILPDWFKDVFRKLVAGEHTVDAVPVVRCKDCDFSRRLDKLEARFYCDECRACECPDASQEGYMIVFPEHFCSYGERKTDGET